MRIASVGWVAHSEDEVFSLADRFTEITHNHPDGITAARATSLTVFLARAGHNQQFIKERLSEFYDLNFCTREIAATYQRTELAKDSVPQAIACALEATNYEDAIRLAVSLGGDADTQAAIAEGFAEALFGIDEKTLSEIKSRLDKEMLDVVERFYARYKR